MFHLRTALPRSLHSWPVKVRPQTCLRRCGTFLRFPPTSDTARVQSGCLCPLVLSSLSGSSQKSPWSSPQQTPDRAAQSPHTDPTSLAQAEVLVTHHGQTASCGGEAPKNRCRCAGHAMLDTLCWTPSNYRTPSFISSGLDEMITVFRI